MMKLYLITNIPTSYRIDFFNFLVKELGNDIRICFVRESENDYKSIIGVYKNEPFISNAKFYNKTGNPAWMFEFLFDLIIDRPKIIINGGMSPRSILLSVYCKIFNKKLFIWWGGFALSEQNIGRVKTMFRKIIISFADGGIFYSKFAYDYYSILSNRPFLSVILGNNTRDSYKYNQNILNRVKDVNRQKIRLLTVGFLSKGKNIILILEALRNVMFDLPELELVIAGDGPDRIFLEKFCERNNLDNVIFLGHVNPTDILTVYANSDVYIHPSLIDRWPQTYNEAAAAGLPILISNRSGVHNSYTTHYEEIVLFDPSSSLQLAERITLLSKNKSLRDELGKKALEEALKYDGHYACDEVVKLANA